MTIILTNLRNAVIAGFVLAAVVFLIYLTQAQFVSAVFWPFLVRWLHIMSGVMWIGLLWYFNFVQTPSMPKIPDEQKPAISKVIAPAALFWFRWGAMATIFFGLILAVQNGYIVEAYTLDAVDGFINYNFMLIGIGMWLGTIMWFNVWFIIWPNQKKVLGIVQVAPDQKAAAAKRAGMASRINTMLSIPMLYFMVAQSHGGLAF